MQVSAPQPRIAHFMKFPAVALSAALAGSLLLAVAAPTAALDGTTWRLVRISGMDDSSHVPVNPARYTLELRSDRSAVIVADCNRGQGEWVQDSPGQLRFGPIAATRALCPPDSISDRYLAQFPWVRSFVVREGHLYLATMADGSIIEFEPIDGPGTVTATVLGEDLRVADASKLQAAILSRLFDRYAAEQDIEAKRDEIDTYVERIRAETRQLGLGAEEDLTAEEAATLETMRRDMAAATIRQWKINRSLYQSHGGRIVYQQFGPEPLDAYRRFLEQRRDAGDFVIRDPDLAVDFWRYFTDETMHDFMEPGGDDEKNAFETPPWSR